MNYYPILIPVKQHSRRCPGKNNILLPILYKSLSIDGVIDRCIVLCDSDEIALTTRQTGFNTWTEPKASFYNRKTDNTVEMVTKSVCDSEFKSMNQWRLWYLSLSEEERKTVYGGIEFDTDYCFLAPVTQPFKNMYFYNTVYRNIEEISWLNKNTLNCRVIVSSTTVRNRDRFDIHYDDRNSEGLLKQVEFDKNVPTRRGCDCDFRLNINGAWYFINMDWMEHNVCVQTDREKQNSVFWNGSNMYTVIDDEQPTIDIDDDKDMKQLLFMIKHFK